MQTATQAIVNYVPASQREWAVLLDYVETNSAAINLRKTAAYTKETAVCAEILSKHYRVNPPQLKIKACPWKQLGVSDTVKTIAHKYKVPVYMVTGDVHSALSY